MSTEKLIQNHTYTMPHLPTEIWLLIAAHCDPRDLWLSLRQVNRQLRECAEQHFERELLPHVGLSLPVAIPTYDMRSQNQGKAVFHIDQASGSCGDPERVSYFLYETEPEQYSNHFLARWKGMCDSNPGGWMNERVSWDMSLETRIDRARLRKPYADATRHNTSGYASVSFEWKPAMTSFFR